MAETQKYLLAIAVGPVQEFIASARKLRDLWYGSSLLSELSKAVAKELADNGCNLIFPGVDDPDELDPLSDLNAANKIIAWVETTEEQLPILAEKGRAAFTRHWLDVAEDAFYHVPRKDREKIDRELFNSQLEDFGEYFAAWTPLTEDYPASLRRCEALLAGRKSLRDFTPPAWEGAGLAKSSLDGVRETVLRGKEFDTLSIKQGEQLDAMGLVKRFGRKMDDWGNIHFDSFAEVAARPLEKQIVNHPEGGKIWRQMPGKETLYSRKSDNALWLEELKSPSDHPARDLMRAVTQTVTDEGFPSELLHYSLLEEEYYKFATEETQELWHMAGAVVKSVYTDIGTPSPYVCLLVGDGDNMGQTLSKMTGMEQHRRFSRELDRFSREIHDIFTDHSGQAIYSGGDDVMGCLPLDTALDCATAINTCFAEVMQEACAGTGLTELPTFSLGIAIVHMKEPLDQALQLARRAESMAKQQGRNRLAIIQAKRSGSNIELCDTWDDTDHRPSLVTRMKEWVANYSSGGLSSRLAYQLREVAKECGDSMEWTGSGETATPRSPAALEALRFIRHKNLEAESFTKERATALLAGHTSLYHLASELVVAHQFAQAVLRPQKKGEE